jgi:hypothetical protein
MANVYFVITVLIAVLLVLSGLGKVLRHPRPVKAIHETVGVPLAYFPLLAACEFAGAVGLVAGIWRPALGLAAAIGVVLYFVGAIASHLRVGDGKGIGPAVVGLILAAGALALRVLTM